MTEAQLKAAGRLIRNMCQPKTKITDGKQVWLVFLCASFGFCLEQILDVQNGKFDGSKKLMCYIDCAYTTFKVVSTLFL